MPDQAHHPQSDKKPTRVAHLPLKVPETDVDIGSSLTEQALPDVSAMPALSMRQVVQLQRTIGNRATNQLIQRTRTQAVVAKPTQLRTAPDMRSTAMAEAAPTAPEKHIQRMDIDASVTSKTDMRALSGAKMEEFSGVTAIEAGKTITVDSDFEMTRLSASGKLLKNSNQIWHKVVAINGVPTTTALWIHVNTIKATISQKPAPPPALAPAPLSSMPSTPAAPVSSGSLPPASAGLVPTPRVPAPRTIFDLASDVPAPPPARAPSPAEAPAPTKPPELAPLPSATSGAYNPLAVPVSDTLTFKPAPTVKSPLLAHLAAPSPAPAPAPQPYNPQKAVEKPSAWSRFTRFVKGGNEARKGIKEVQSQVIAGAQVNYLAQTGIDGASADGLKASGDSVDLAKIINPDSAPTPSVSTPVPESVPAPAKPDAANTVLTNAKDLNSTTPEAPAEPGFFPRLATKLAGIYGAISDNMPFIMFADSIRSLIDKIMDYQSMNDANKGIMAKSEAGELTPEETAVHGATIYALPKMKRGVLSRFTKFLFSLAKMILHIITLISGGASAMVTEAGALTITLAQGAITFGRGVKAIYKIIKGTRGKNRETNAKTLLDAALNNQPEALTMVRELNPFPFMEKWMTRARTVGGVMVKGSQAAVAAMGPGDSGLDPSAADSASDDGRMSAYPQTNAEMLTRLQEFVGDSDAKRKKIETELANKMKSS